MSRSLVNFPQEFRHDEPEWAAAAEALILVAEQGGPTMFARIGVMRAINRGKPNPDLGPLRKRAKAYRDRAARPAPPSV